MPWYSPREKQERRRRTLWLLLALTAGLLVFTAADQWLWRTLSVRDPAAPAEVQQRALDRIEGRDWYQLLRLAGYLPTWLVIGAAVALAGARRGSTHAASKKGNATAAAVLVMLSAALGGAAAEVVKLLTHRWRPGTTGEYIISWSDRGPGYGMASSHAGVAFGAAFMIWRLWPRAGPLAFAVACGCGLTRLLTGAHFATDVYVAAVLGYAVAAWLWEVGDFPAGARA